MDKISTNGKRYTEGFHGEINKKKLKRCTIMGNHVKLGYIGKYDLRLP